jgi:hypothetical protein
LLAHGRGAHPRGPGEDHVERQQEEQKTAGDPERRQPDAQGFEQHVAGEGEQEQDA